MSKTEVFFPSLTRPLCALVLVGLMLPGCSNVKETLGLGKRAPDEFAVTTGRPLELPPSMLELPPPDPGAARPQEVPARAEARMALFGPSDQPVRGIGGDNYSAGEAALLAHAGAAQTERGIRLRVDRETEQLVEESKAPLERLMVWSDPNPRGTVVDAPKEAERIRANMAAGRPITDGETPMIDFRPRALLEGIF